MALVNKYVRMTGLPSPKPINFQKKDRIPLSTQLTQQHEALHASADHQDIYSQGCHGPAISVRLSSVHYYTKMSSIFNKNCMRGSTFSNSVRNTSGGTRISERNADEVYIANYCCIAMRTVPPRRRFA